jgi:hypothetical protein
MESNSSSPRDLYFLLLLPITGATLLRPFGTIPLQRADNRVRKL